MPNFRNWTASEIVAQMPQARNVLAKHFGPEGITTASGASLRGFFCPDLQAKLTPPVRILERTSTAHGA
jgi:hypothetical protein